MIFVRDSFNLHPASPETLDRFCCVAQDRLLPAVEQAGGQTVGAWFCHEEWFSQVVHVTAFEDLAAYGDFLQSAGADGSLADAAGAISELAPERGTELMETLGPIAEKALDDAIEKSQAEPAGVYTFAILDVLPGCMDRFKEMLGAAGALLPIVASWRHLSGNPDRITDLWSGDTGGFGYSPSNDQTAAFFGPLREVAPRERMMRLHVLPHSKLR